MISLLDLKSILVMVKLCGPPDYQLPNFSVNQLEIKVTNINVLVDWFTRLVDTTHKFCMNGDWRYGSVSETAAIRSDEQHASSLLQPHPKSFTPPDCLYSSSSLFRLQRGERIYAVLHLQCAEKFLQWSAVQSIVNYVRKTGYRLEVLVILII